MAMLWALLKGGEAEMISPEAVVYSLIGLLSAAGAAYFKQIERRGRREAQRAQELIATTPPTPPAEREPTGPFPRQVDLDNEMAELRIRQAEALVRRANWTIEEMQQELNRVGRDHQKTAASLTAEREHSQQLHRKAEELGSQLAEMSKRLFALECRLGDAERERDAAIERLADAQAKLDNLLEEQSDTSVTPMLPRAPLAPAALPPLRVPKLPQS